MIVVRLAPLGEAPELPHALVPNVSCAGNRGTSGPARRFARSSTVDGTHECRTPPSRPRQPPQPHAAQGPPAAAELPSYARESEHHEYDLGRLYASIRQARRIAVVCGAGISVSSPANIPDFRSASGLFRKLKERYPNAGLSSGKDLFDARLFGSESATSLFYAMMAELKDLSDAAEPTLFHHLLKRLDQEGRLQRVYTQNIDGLEAKAGLSFGLGTDPCATDDHGLGKRRRTRSPPHTFARSQSDSAVLQPSWHCEPLFPRAIPLHGSLSALTCMQCSAKLWLSGTRADGEARSALSRMRAGEHVWCRACEASECVRVAAGLRPRGVGCMKIDVVLYNGNNETAEQVGACVERDILGLRDPNEPNVPETPAEARARERRERRFAQGAPPPATRPGKENVEGGRGAGLGEGLTGEPSWQALNTEVSNTEASNTEASTTGTPAPHDEIGDLSMNADDADKDDVLASAFGEALGSCGASGSGAGDAAWGPHRPAAKEEDAGADPPSPSRTRATETTGKTERDVAAPPLCVAPTRPRTRLKPLPPDMLIVAGTSLKIPGTRRIVREFSRACRAQGGGNRGSAPIRTVYLNYDFPSGAREWDGVFDMWVQGDVQQAALGLCAPIHGAPTDALAEAYIERHCWKMYAEDVGRRAMPRERQVAGDVAEKGTGAATRRGTGAATGRKTKSGPPRQPTLRMPSTKLSTGAARGKGTPPTKDTVRAPQLARSDGGHVPS
ncbi:hypothetical protein MSPP1_002042 [Malassezia sp. CBS 17886]|nr:hypothetical protein MSPP1_002042 [Malassezia sp. CBS 17886]